MKRITTLLAALVAAGPQPSAEAVGPPPELLGPTTFAAVSVSLEQLPPQLLVDQALALVEASAPVGDRLKSAYTVLNQFRELGAYDLSTAMAITDLPGGAPPPLVVSFKEGSDLAAAEQLLTEQPWFQAPFATRVDGEKLWIGATAMIDRAMEEPFANREDLRQPLNDSRLSGAAVTLVLSPGADARRVLRELWPRLDAPFNRLNGALVADGIQRIVLEIRPTDTAVDAALRIVTDSESTATRVLELAETGRAAGIEAAKTLSASQVKLAESFAQLIQPTRQDAEVIVALDSRTATQGLMATLLPTVQEARAHARRSQKMNDMKQIALGVLNFESANGFLSDSICDEQGEPLLSWRVAILPFLEEQALFDEFHLNEPWDSPHNLQVAKTLPQVFFASTANEELALQGRTTYLRPVYPQPDSAPATKLTEPVEKQFNGQTYFYRQGVTYRQIIDGTANTVMIAEVAPEHAVLWTKPADWRVDREDLLAKLRTDAREGFVTAWYDGHANYLKFTIRPEFLRKVITKAGKERIDWNEAYPSDPASGSDTAR